MTDHFKNTLNKITSGDFKVAVIGLGYIGLPLLLRFAESGAEVIGLDVDCDKINKLNSGMSYIRHIPSSRISNVQEKIYCTLDFANLNDADVIIICVPTPLNKYREPDLNYVINTINSALPHLKKGQLVCLESTTYPGTTQEELLPRIETTELCVGKDIFLAYSPEREDPGNMSFSTQTIPKIVSGYSESCLEIAKAVYSRVCDEVIPVSALNVAEMTKLLENIHRAVNIGLVNEMKILADKMGINIYEVIAAAKTKPFGFAAYYPGPGLGGHCIPIDPFYLTYKAREYGMHTRFIELAGEVNSAMPAYVVGKIMHGLNQNEKSLKASRVLILGIAYKKNVDDMRESPAVEIMDQLLKLGAIVDYSDPYVLSFPKMRKYKFDNRSVEITPQTLANYDCVVIATDHDVFDYNMIANHSALIVDSRGVYKTKQENVVQA